MTTMDRDEAVRQLERLGDLGRGSTPWGEWRRSPQQMRSRWPAAGALAVLAAPQAIIGGLGGVSPQGELALLIGAAVPAGYVLATGTLGPALPAWRNRLWLCSKIAGATMTGCALAALLLAGPFGILVAAPALAVAAVTAIGTALLRRGLVVGAIPTIGVFALLGLVCAQYHFGDSADTLAVRGVAVSAFAVAGIIAAIAVLSVVAAGHGE